jgi:hypothetical protein
MRVATILRRVLKSCREAVHATRFAAVLAVACGVVHARRLNLSAVGRALRGRAYPKHGIKRVDRLLSNWRMRLECRRYFKDLAQYLIGPCPAPVVLLDWTKITEDFEALVAAVPIGGRAVTIYHEVHPEAHLANPQVQAAFLRGLGQVVPPGCRPIIVTDAGFRGPFFRAVRELGWDFVGRVRGHTMMRTRPSAAWKTVAQLAATAGRHPTDLGTHQMGKDRRYCVDVRLVLAAKLRRRRKKHPWSGRRWSRQGGISPTTISGGKEPWLLATSVSSDTAAAQSITAIYASRMQIEETFRDAKNHRYGWSLRHVRTTSAHRLTILMLLAVLATVAVTLLGLSATADGRHRRYQANTVRTRVLSFFVLGVALLERDDHRGLADPVRFGRQHARKSLLALCPG